MFKTNVSPKASKIATEGKKTKIDEAIKRPKAQTLSPDTFVKPKASRWRKLKEGRKPAPAYFGMQGLLESMKFSDETPRGQVDEMIHEAPYVPNLEKDIFKHDPDRHNDMKPVVDRYLGLEKVLRAQLAENAKFLSPKHMCKLSAPEIRRLRQFREVLKKSYFKCQKQLNKAELYLRWERTNKAEKAKQFKEELKFWK